MKITGLALVFLSILSCTTAHETPRKFLRDAASTSSTLSTSGDWSLIGQEIFAKGIKSTLGISVAISADGSIFAAGGPFNRDNGNNAGYACVFKLNGSTWEQYGTPIHGNIGDYAGTSVSLSDDGNTMAVGSPGNKIAGNNAGQTRVFKLNNGDWEQMGSDINGRTIGDYSGRSVYLSGDGETIAIGSPDNSEKGSSSGQLRVFEFKNNDWIQKGGKINGEATGDMTGWSVALSNDGGIVAWGAPFNRGQFNNAGQVRAYSFDGDWNQIGQDIEGTQQSERSGYDIDISSNGNILAVSAPNNRDNGNNSGAVRVYELSENNQWEQLGNQMNGENQGDNFGIDVSLSADGYTLAVGSPLNRGQAQNSGMSRILQYANTTKEWVQTGNDIDGINRQDMSGMVALSENGSIIAIGAPNARNGGNAAGSVRVFGNVDAHKEITDFISDGEEVMLV